MPCKRTIVDAKHVLRAAAISKLSQGCFLTLLVLAESSSSSCPERERSLSIVLSAASLICGCSGPENQPVIWPATPSVRRASADRARRSVSRASSSCSGIVTFSQKMAAALDAGRRDVWSCRRPFLAFSCPDTFADQVAVCIVKDACQEAQVRRAPARSNDVRRYALLARLKDLLLPGLFSIGTAPPQSSAVGLQPRATALHLVAYRQKAAALQASRGAKYLQEQILPSGLSQVMRSWQDCGRPSFKAAQEKVADAFHL